jgi:hypothetical protein
MAGLVAGGAGLASHREEHGRPHHGRSNFGLAASRPAALIPPSQLQNSLMVKPMEKLKIIDRRHQKHPIQRRHRRRQHRCRQRARLDQSEPARRKIETGSRSIVAWDVCTSASTEEIRVMGNQKWWAHCLGGGPYATTQSTWRAKLQPIIKRRSVA